MKPSLDELTKEDLIKVIAEMHDTIQEWDNGLGLPPDTANSLIKIGRACTEYCANLNDFEVPQITYPKA